MSVSRLLRRLGPVAGLAAVWALFALLVGPNFTSWDNQRLMLLQTAVVACAAVGATLIIISGGIDLSVGATIALGTVVVAMAIRSGAPPAVGALAGLGAAIVVGMVIGLTVTGRVATVAAAAIGAVLAIWAWPHLGPIAAASLGLVTGAAGALAAERWAPRVELSPFIVTLGLWGAVRGLAKGIADNQPVYPGSSSDDLGWIGSLMQVHGGFLLPAGVWVMLGCATVIAALLHLTRFGRHVVAVGSSEATARLCGIEVAPTRVLVYVIGVACAGVAAILQCSYLSMGDPTTAEGYELRIIAAAVIGGASLSGGEGGIVGTLIGAMLMTVVDTGCTKLGLDNWVQEVVTGAIIVAAVVIDRVRRGAKS